MISLYEVAFELKPLPRNRYQKPATSVYKKRIRKWIEYLTDVEPETWNYDDDDDTRVVPVKTPAKKRKPSAPSPKADKPKKEKPVGNRINNVVREIFD